MCKHSKTLCASDSYLLAARRQRVPSPSGMPALELIDDLIDAINDPPARCMDADVSDERVTAYMEALDVCHSVKCFQGCQLMAQAQVRNSKPILATR